MPAKIKDLAADANCVSAYILSAGGFLGMGTHYVAVVPSQITIIFDAKDKRWQATMNAAKDELKFAPEFKYEGPGIGSKS